MSVLDNVKAGLHNHDKYSLFTSIVHTPKYFKVEKTMNEEAMKLLKVFDLDKEADILAYNLPYGNRESWRLPEHWQQSRSFFFWMSRLQV